MKIIILIISLELGGAERRALHLARYFKQRGHHVELWGFNPGSLSEVCKNEGIPGKLLPFQWAGFSKVTLKSFKRLLFALREARPDILLPHTILPTLACGFVWRLSGARKCIGYMGGSEFGLVSRWGEFLGIQLVSGMICNAQHLARSIAQTYRLDPRKITLIRNGVTLSPPQFSRSVWREQLGIKDDTFLAVMVANLSVFKDQEGLLRAWELVRTSLTSKDKDVRLLLAGKDFGTGAKLRELSSKLGIENDVLFLGQVQDVSGLLAAVDLCVFSSPSEGCPNGILEAMSSGLAVAAVDNDGIREAVGEHQYPWLSAVGDGEAFARHIVSLIQDDTLRVALGKQNRQRIRDEFLFDKMCRETENLIFDSLTLGKTNPLAIDE